MRPLTVRFLNLLISVGAVILALLSRGYTGLIRAGLLVGAAFLIALVMFLSNKYWICPHCHERIGRIGFFETTCPHCGKSLK